MANSNCESGSEQLTYCGSNTVSFRSWLIGLVLIAIIVATATVVLVNRVIQTGILTEFWRDALAIIGAIGVLLTAAGVWLAREQMRRTVSANEAATRAAVDALNESRTQYDRYAFAQISRLLAEAVLHVKKEQWTLAALRLGDLAELLLQVTRHDGNRENLAGRLRRMESTFDRIADGKAVYSASMEGKWRKLSNEVKLSINRELAPFAWNEKGTDG